MQSRSALSQPLDRPPGNAALLGPQGILAAYPGPAVIIASTGEIIAQNASAPPLVDALTHRTELGALIGTVLRDGVARVETILLRSPAADTETALELTLMPHGEGAGLLVLGRDATLERNLRSALIDSRQRFKDLVGISSDFSWETDREGCFAFVSGRGALGHAVDDMVGRNAADFVIRGPTGLFATRQPVDGQELLMTRADGEPAYLSVSAIPVFDAEERWSGVRGIAKDVTELRRREAELAKARAKEELVESIVRPIRDETVQSRILPTALETLCAAFRADGALLQRIAGGQAGAVLTFGATLPEGSLEAILSGLGRDRGEIAARIDGRPVIAVTTEHHQEVNGILCLWRADPDAPDWDAEAMDLLEQLARQISIAIEQVANTEQLERLSRTDALTGLANRRAFLEDLEHALLQSNRTRRSGALLFVDLDNFKHLNDTIGHEAGDKALMLVAQLLSAQVRQYDLLARLGGDEFAVWLDGTDETEAPTAARRFLAIKTRVGDLTGDPEKPLGLSIGVAVTWPQAAETVQELLNRADHAMYMVKRAGKGSVQMAPPPPMPAEKSTPAEKPTPAERSVPGEGR
jgi:diguanylate cyclase (GGDEF)-like protein/PAS domain S-box-containing protein